MRQYGGMGELERLRGRSLADRALGTVGAVVLVVIGLWLALRVVAGVLRLIVWLTTTAVVVVLIVAALYLVFGRRGRRSDY